MITTTTSNIEGKEITGYLGIVTGEAIMGANIFRDFLAGIRNIIGDRAGAYENKLIDARDPCVRWRQRRRSAVPMPLSA